VWSRLGCGRATGAAKIILQIDAENVARRVRASYIELPADKPANYDSNDLVAEYGPDALAQLLESPKVRAMRYRLLSSADLTNAPPLAWLVRGVLPSQGLACVFGAAPRSKSVTVKYISNQR
jgi:putative DNA primase/helicase